MARTKTDKNDKNDKTKNDKLEELIEKLESRLAIFNIGELRDRVLPILQELAKVSTELNDLRDKLEQLFNIPWGEINYP